MYAFYISYKDYRNKTVTTMIRDYLIADHPYKGLEAKKPVSIDGKLGEWNNLTTRLEQRVLAGDAKQHSGEKDCLTHIAFSYDAQNLYFAAKIQDDTVVDAQKNIPVYAQDGVQFYVDPRPRSERLANPHYRDCKIDILVSPGADSASALFQTELPVGVRCAAVRNSGGYAVETAIPLSMLKSFQGGDWRDFGFNFVVNDIDKPGEKKIAFGLRSIEKIWENSSRFATFER